MRPTGTCLASPALRQSAVLQKIYFVLVQRYGCGWYLSKVFK